MKTKIDRASKMMAHIDETHDMVSGQAYSWEACGRCGTDVCRICGLRHAWFRRGQNSPDGDNYEDSHGNMLTLAEAADADCN